MSTLKRKIISILLNPTVDVIYEIEHFKVGHTYQVRQPLIYPVGKAISFSLALKTLNPSFNDLRVFGFVGKEELDLYSQFLKKNLINFEFIPIKGKTRSNKTIIDPVEHTTTHIRELGFIIETTELNQFFTSLNNMIQKNDVVIFTGSIPPSLNSDTYFNLISEVKKRGACTILDTSGEGLIKGIAANPTMIKPNLIELNQILNGSLAIKQDFTINYEDIVKISKLAKNLLNNELEIILITLGEKGAILVKNNIILYGFIEIRGAIDTVGCGDAFLAGFIYNYFQEKSFLDCFKLALACGTANALTPGPGILKKKDVDMLLSKTKIWRVN